MLALSARGIKDESMPSTSARGIRDLIGDTGKCVYFSVTYSKSWRYT